MYYFVSGMLYYRLSGIEIAQVRREKLFMQNKVNAKIVTVSYNNYLHVNLPIYQLDENMSINLFDYFQKAEDPKNTIAKIGTILVNNHYQRSQQGQFVYFVDANNVRRVWVKLFEQNLYGHEFSEDQVEEVHFSDENGNDVRMDTYDTRGFLSRTTLFGQRGGISQEIYFSPEGQPKMYFDYERDDFNNVSVNEIRVYAHDQWHTFSNFGELTGFFLDCLNNQESETTTFISDKAEIADRAIFNMKTKARKLCARHSTHTYDGTRPYESRLNDIIVEEFKNREKISAIITATEQQAKDMAVRFLNETKTLAVPVSYVPSSAKQVEFSKRNATKLIAVARIHDEKRIEDMLDVVSEVKKTVPEVSLDIYGYVTDDNYYNRLKDQINELHLQDAVSFKGYLPNIEQKYDESVIYLMTSTYESINMALLESVSHGNVAFAYDINYGPKELIENGKSGFLIRNGHKNEMAKKIAELLSDPKKLESMSEDAYAKAQEFSAEAVWNKWDKLVVNNNNLEVL